MFVSQGIKIAPYPLPKYPEHAKPRLDGAEGDIYPFADEGVTTAIRDATISGKPYPVKGWFVYSTNLMQALPNEAETIKAIQQLDLFVGRRHPARHHLPGAARRNPHRFRPHRLGCAAPAGGGAAARPETGLVDCQATGREAGHR